MLKFALHFLRVCGMKRLTAVIVSVLLGCKVLFGVGAFFCCGLNCVFLFLFPAFTSGEVGGDIGCMRYPVSLFSGLGWVVKPLLVYGGFLTATLTIVMVGAIIGDPTIVATLVVIPAALIVVLVFPLFLGAVLVKVFGNLYARYSGRWVNTFILGSAPDKATIEKLELKQFPTPLSSDEKSSFVAQQTFMVKHLIVATLEVLTIGVTVLVNFGVALVLTVPLMNLFLWLSYI